MNIIHRHSVLLLAFLVSTGASAITVQKAAKLKGTDVHVGYDIYGASVAIDGDTVVVGNPDIGNYVGSAYVFVKPSNGWHDMTQTAKLIPSDGVVTGVFGNNVAVHGGVIAVSDYADNKNHGKIYVYVKPAGGWSGTLTETAQLTASDDNSGYLLGRTLAMDSQGTIYGGAPLNGNGTVYVFVKPKSGWKTTTENAELTSSNGTSVAIASQALIANGDTVVAGAAGWPDGFSGPDYGAAYIWVKPPGGWVSAAEETALMTASDHQPGDLLGDSVALDRDVLIVGAPGINGEAGGAYAYVKPSTGWATTSSFVAKLGAPNLQSGYALGNSAAISGAFTVLGVDGFLEDEGAIYFYRNPQLGGGTDQLIPELLIADPLKQAFAAFGTFIAAQGGIVVATAYDEQPVGGAYLFSIQQ